MEQRLVTSTLRNEDIETENILRPTTLQEYIGQERLKSNLSVYINAAKQRGEHLDHVLLYGSAGLGKTTLAHIIANELNSRILVTSGPAIERAADLAAILTNLQDNDVLFIDEIHRLNHSIEEILYPAMEDYALDFVVGKGPSARSVRLPIAKYTLIGATTKIGMIAQPLRDRFGVHAKLEPYVEQELSIIIQNSARKLKIDIDEDAAREIAKRCRGTPRIANRLLKRIRDFAQVMGEGSITLKTAKYGLEAMEIDFLGLDNVDKGYLLTAIDKFNGGPVGIDTIAAAVGEDASTLEDVYEPYLLQLGFISKTPRGRVVMPAAYKHLQKQPNTTEAQISIFDFKKDNE
jgi:Holliday junction DNA helicase RuvB